jgi:hypothetical protein
MNVMDYSLVIGIDGERKDLVLGIIGLFPPDCLTQISFGHLHGTRNLKAGSKSEDLSVEEQKNQPSSPRDNIRIGILSNYRR